MTLRMDHSPFCVRLPTYIYYDEQTNSCQQYTPRRLLLSGFMVAWTPEHYRKSFMGSGVSKGSSSLLQSGRKGFLVTLSGLSGLPCLSR